MILALLLSAPLIFLVVVFLVDWLIWRPLKLQKQRRSLGTVAWKQQVKEKVDTVIIGSGQGGLSCGSVLAQFGEKVVVLEQHEVTGGGAHCFAVDGKAKWRFDAGHHITIPLQQQLLHVACGTTEAPVAFDRTADREPCSDTILLGEPKTEDDHLGLPIRDDKQLTEELLRRFPDQKAAIRRYFDTAESVQMRFGLSCAAAILPMPLRKLLLRSPVMGLWRKWASMTAADGLRHFFPDSARLRSYLSGLWLDTACLPSRGSFFMQTAVMGGWQKVGVAYPRGGPQRTTDAMVDAIERRGGAVFVRAPVAKILTENNRASGVQLTSGDVILADKVVSALGYRATERLLGEHPSSSSSSSSEANEETKGEDRLKTAQSAGFLMANVALRGTAADLGISASNVWIQPANRANGFDAIHGCDAYFADPLEVDLSLIPVGITFPSVKELGPGSSDEDYHTCQILTVAEYDWFSKYMPLDAETITKKGARHAPPHIKRAFQEEYDDLKQRWADRLVALLHKRYPKTKGRVVFTDISTPLTLETYLRSLRGSSIGLDVTPDRFVDPSELAELDMKHPRVHNLWRCGQDYLMCGQVLAAASGIVCALRIRGPLDALRFACRSLRLLLSRGKS